MPYNNSYEEGDEEAQAGNPQRNDPAHVPRAGAGADESTLLQGVDTYFSDEKILIPENEKVIQLRIRFDCNLWLGIWRHVMPIRSQSSVDLRSRSVYMRLDASNRSN